MKSNQSSDVKAVEKALLDLALSGHYQAIVFYLRNKCPERWSNNPENLSELTTTYSGYLSDIKHVKISIDGEDFSG